MSKHNEDTQVAKGPIDVEDLRKAFAELDAVPFKIGGNHPPGTASFVDDNPDNPVQLCDSQGNQLVLMTLDEYKAFRAHKPISMGCRMDVPVLPAGHSFECEQQESVAELIMGCLLPERLTPSLTNTKDRK